MGGIKGNMDSPKPSKAKQNNELIYDGGSVFKKKIMLLREIPLIEFLAKL